MSQCPDLGRLRSWLDHSEPEVSRHIAGCRTCGDAVAGLRANAELAQRKLALLARADDQDVHAVAAPDRDEPAPASPPPRPLALPRTRSEILAKVAAVAVVTVLAGVTVATPGGRSAAAAFLAQFRSERFAVVTVDPAEFGQGFEGLTRLGTISGDYRTEPREVASLEQAERVSGLTASAPPRSALPDGVAFTPTVHAAPGRELRLTFDRDMAPELPTAFDGAVLRIDVPAFVLLHYDSDAGDGMVIAEAEQVTAEVTGGPSLDEVRKFLLESDYLPPGVTSQLRAIDDWRSTLPLPIPVDDVAWRDARVGDAPAIVFGDESGLGSAVLWQVDGHVHAVAGTLPARQIQRLAEQL